MRKRYPKSKSFNENLSKILIIKKSLIKGAGQGAFAKVTIPKGMRIGEYNGKVLGFDDYKTLSDKSYIFEVIKKFEKKYYLFYIDAKSGDELRFVNGAYSKEQKKNINVESYQYAERVFFKAKKTIKKGQELIIDYGNNYWK